MAGILCSWGALPKEICDAILGIPGFEHYGQLSALLIQFLGVLNVLVSVIIALALIFFLWGMAIFILNSGQEEKRKEGKQKMIWGVIVLAVMVAIWGIVKFVLGAFALSPGGSVLPPIFIPPVF